MEFINRNNSAMKYSIFVRKNFGFQKSANAGRLIEKWRTTSAQPN